MNVNSMVTKICKQWTSNISTMLGIIVLIGFFGMIGTAHSASIQTTESNGTRPAPSSNLTNLKIKLELFKAKYNATLLNYTFLPFTKDCSAFLDKSPEEMSNKDRICITYYDMINSIYQLNEFENADSVTEVLKKYNEISIADHFCNDFPDEIRTRLEKQPFAEAKHIKNWLKLNSCVTSCMFEGKNSTWHILDICKLISGGLSMAVNKSKIETQSVAPEVKKEIPTPNKNINNNGTNPIDDQKNMAITNQEPTNADKLIKTPEKIIETHQVEPKIDEPAQSNEEDQPPKDPIAGLLAKIIGRNSQFSCGKNVCFLSFQVMVRNQSRTMTRK